MGVEAKVKVEYFRFVHGKGSRKKKKIIKVGP